MERRKFAASATAFMTALFIGSSSKLTGQTKEVKKKVDDVDAATGEKITFSKVTDIKDEQVDGVIYRKIGTEYFKRDFDGNLNVLWFGAKGDGVTDDTDAFNKAFATIEKKTIYVPSTRNGYVINSTVTIPNNKNIIGDGKGNGVNTRTKLLFKGSGIMFNVLSYYVTIKDLHVMCDKGGSEDTTAFFINVNQTIMDNVTINGFKTGIRNTFKTTTFSHVFKSVMISGCGIGANFDTANNITFEACFFDANDVCVGLNKCSQVSFSNGTVMQMHGNLATGFKAVETNDSRILDINNSRAISLRDCYFEVGAGSTTLTNQKIATLQSVSGFNFTGNYCIGSFKPGQPPLFDIADDKCFAVNIIGNSFLRVGPKTYIVGASGTGSPYNVNINSNRLSANGIEVDNSFKPRLIVGGAESSARYSIQTGYCVLENGNVHVFGTIALSRKDSTAKGELSIGALPIPIKKGMDPALNLLGSLMIKNAANVKNGKHIEINSGSTLIKLKDENGNPINMEDLSDNSVINFSINYPSSQNVTTGA